MKACLLAAAVICLLGPGETSPASETEAKRQIDFARAEVSQGRFERALASSESALRLCPECREATLLKALAYDGLGRRALATSVLLAFKETTPPAEHTKADRILAWFEKTPRSKPPPEGARAALRGFTEVSGLGVLELQPPDPEVYRERAKEALAQERCAVARVAAVELLDALPEDREGLRLAGDAAACLGDVRAAVLAWRTLRDLGGVEGFTTEQLDALAPTLVAVVATWAGPAGSAPAASAWRIEAGAEEVLPNAAPGDGGAIVFEDLPPAVALRLAVGTRSSGGATRVDLPALAAGERRAVSIGGGGSGVGPSRLAPSGAAGASKAVESQAADPASVDAALEAKLPRLHAELRKAARARKDAVLRLVFGPALAEEDPEQHAMIVGHLRSAILQDLTGGKARYECRARVCAIEVTRGDTASTFWFAPADNEVGFVVHDARPHLERFAQQVTFSLHASGPGTVRVLLNGRRTFAVDDVRDTSSVSSMINGDLRPGPNTLTLVPLDLAAGASVEVDLRVGGWDKTARQVDTSASNLVAWTGALTERREFRFEAPADPASLDVAGRLEASADAWLAGAAPEDAFGPWLVDASRADRDALLSAGVRRFVLLSMEIELVIGESPTVYVRSGALPRADGPHVLFLEARSGDGLHVSGAPLDALGGDLSAVAEHARRLHGALSSADCPGSIRFADLTPFEAYTDFEPMLGELRSEAAAARSGAADVCALVAGAAGAVSVRVDDVGLLALDAQDRGVGVLRVDLEILAASRVGVEIGALRAFE